MRDNYHEQLDAITDELVQMTKLVGSAINRATQALLDADLQLAESVIEGDETVDALAAEIDNQCFDLAARQQPVATDLRIIMSGIRISMSVERMGDLAKHVAKQTRLRYPKSSIPPELRGTFAQMGGLAEAIVSSDGHGDHVQGRQPRQRHPAATTTRWTSCTGSCSASCCRRPGPTASKKRST